jgi:hypothetical protein
VAAPAASSVPVLLLLLDSLVSVTVRFAILSIRYSFCFGYSGSLIARSTAVIVNAASCTILASVVAQVFFVR